MDDHVRPRRVVILGGGFAGLFAVRALRSAPVAVTLVDPCAHHLFQPLLYQCASGILSEGQIAQPLRAVLRRHPQVRCTSRSRSLRSPPRAAGRWPERSTLPRC
ncbi:FAD-dependent oxidoreductase [Streptomyces virginiae]|uniref:FAD-dependent oxidoreductase n=1 Tax=Streptomyces virginiae TaxID=1961 RepID=UPI0036E1F0C0